MWPSEHKYTATLPKDVVENIWKEHAHGVTPLLKGNRVACVVATTQRRVLLDNKQEVSYFHNVAVQGFDNMIAYKVMNSRRLTRELAREMPESIAHAFHMHDVFKYDPHENEFSVQVDYKKFNNHFNSRLTQLIAKQATEIMNRLADRNYNINPKVPCFYFEISSDDPSLIWIYETHCREPASQKVRQQFIRGLTGMYREN